jgi:hypothetical protein
MKWPPKRKGPPRQRAALGKAHNGNGFNYNKFPGENNVQKWEVGSFCTDVDLFPFRLTTPLQVWKHLELALESSRNPNYWTIRNRIKQCLWDSDASDLDEGFSRWFWNNVPRLFRYAYVTPEEAPGIAACLLEACGNYTECARSIFRLHRKSGYKWTEADHRVLILATHLLTLWTSCRRMTTGLLPGMDHDGT